MFSKKKRFVLSVYLIYIKQNNIRENTHFVHPTMLAYARFVMGFMFILATH